MAKRLPVLRGGQADLELSCLLEGRALVTVHRAGVEAWVTVH